MRYCRLCGKELEEAGKAKLCRECRDARRREAAQALRARVGKRESRTVKVCKQCGGPLDDYRRSYCALCRPDPNMSIQDQFIAQKFVQELRRVRQPVNHPELLRGMSLSEVAALARDHGMSYGKFRAFVETMGRMPKKRETE